MTYKEMAALPECSVTARAIEDRVLDHGWSIQAAVTTENQRPRLVLTDEIKASIIEDYARMPQLALKQKYRIDIKKIKKILRGEL